MKAVVLAAGKGKRMGQLGKQHPKPILPVANRPTLEFILARLKSAGVTDVLLVVSEQSPKVRTAVGCGERLGLNVKYAEQKEPLGTGHATGLAADFVGNERFVLSFGDILTAAANYPAFVERASAGDCDAVLTTRWVRDTSTVGVVALDDNGHVTAIVEKPKPGEEPSHFSNAGLFVFQPQIFEALDTIGLSPRGEYELTDAISRLIEWDMKIAAHELQGYWYNLTTPENCIAANRALLLEEDCCIGQHESFHIDQPVAAVPDCIGRGSSLGPNVSVHPTARVGKDCRISDAIVSEDASIGDGSAIAHAVVAAGAQVPDGSRIIGTADVAEVVCP